MKTTKSNKEIEQTKNKIIADFLARTGQINRPPCYKCKGKVPAFSLNVTDDLKTLELALKCHGDKEVIQVEVNRIPYISHIEIGWAFYGGERKHGVIVRPLG